jgi:hypothetical protein
MRNMKKHALLLCAALLMGMNVTAATAALAPVTTTEAAVTVKVTPRNLGTGTWEFDVVFDTHVQELKDDLAKTAVLVAADGTEVAPMEWKGAAPLGHHRTGVLRFQALDPAPAVLVLKVVRTGETKPRVFEWKLR